MRALANGRLNGSRASTELTELTKIPQARMALAVLEDGREEK